METPAQAADRVRELLTEEPQSLLASAGRMRAWVLDHLAETHALRHMLAPFLGFSPPTGPWARFAPLTVTPEGPR